jgi:hypothetical protein
MLVVPVISYGNECHYKWTAALPSEVEKELVSKDGLFDELLSRL